MYNIGAVRDDESSVLVDFVRSGHDESHVGKTSEPYLITADRKSIEQVAYACEAVHTWRLDAPKRREPIEAPHAYMFYLLNNTRTYRVYEQNVIAELPEGRAQLHAGDDFYYYRPIYDGDQLAITATILPVTHKHGRHGDLTFFADEWRMYNQENELAAVLVRRAVALDFSTEDELRAPSDERVDIPPQATGGDRGELRTGDVTHVHDHGVMTWMSMMAWLAAVDEYSPTHFDPDFAKAHRYGNGRSIVAGPQCAARMVSVLEGALGPDWWIASYENVQRRPVYPGEKLTSFGVVDSASGNEAVIKLWLVDDAGIVKGTANAKAARDEGVRRNA